MNMNLRMKSTARIYDIVRKVVIPARISVLTVVFKESNPNSFLSI